MNTEIKTKEEWEKELKQLMNDPITGLKESSNTNKTRYGILGLFEEALSSQKQRLIQRIEGMKKTPSIFDESDVYLSEEQEKYNAILSQAIEIIKED